MKKFLLGALLLLSALSFSQTEYNKNNEVLKDGDYGLWTYVDDDSSSIKPEIFITKQTSEGYSLFYNEALKVFKFYGITSSNLSYEGSIPRSTKLSNSLYTSLVKGDIKVSKLYETDTVKVVVICSDSTNSIYIKNLY